MSRPSIRSVGALAKIGLEHALFFCHFTNAEMEIGRLEDPAESLSLSIEMRGKWLLDFWFGCKDRINREVHRPVKELYIHTCPTTYCAH